MKIEILGAYGGNSNSHRLTSFLVDDFLAVDAGSLTSALNLHRQYQITDVLLSHSHSDHTGTLPYLMDNLFGVIDRPLQVWATAHVVDMVKTHIFNDVIWPNFERLPSAADPSMAFRVIDAERPFRIRHLDITAVPVNHIVPCHAFFIHSRDTQSTVLYTADTTNTDRIWELANGWKDLKGVIVDCSFPNHLEELATTSGHMTPRLLKRDLDKLQRDCPILVYHLKPSFKEHMVRELEALSLNNLHFEIQDQVLYF